MSIEATLFSPVDITGQKISFASPQAQDLSNYWFQLARDINRPPTRASFDPIAIPHLLPSVVLLERLDAGGYQIRLQGTAFRERGLVDRTGEILNREDAEPSRLAFYQAVDKVLDTPCGLRLIAVEQNYEGKQTLVEIVSYPLTDRNNIARFTIFIIVPLKMIGYADGQPRKYALTEIREVTEISLDLRDRVQA
ncbi:MAG: hypothetical protein COA62_13050 [Rhodobiaceae bacterium]|nr:MAG: hypothetical protein COA62_13050 [Rhodobiaceae bacterium]